jgi:hypothetical protein
MANQKTNWKYILIVLILGLIVGGGILGYLRYFKREMISISQFPEIKKPEKPKIGEETADWVTYKNEKYGFEFKYPREFAENEFCMARETEGGIEVGRFISISIEDSKGLNLSEYIDSVFPKEFNIESKENIIVGGEEAVKINYSFSGPGAYGEAVFLLKDKKAYLFEFAYGNNPCVAHKLGIDEFDAFEDIISTFKFLEEETANWKTYRNEELKIEFKYPDNYKIDITGGHSPLAHPELGIRISIIPKGITPDINNPYIDINLVNPAYFASLDDYIPKTYENRISPIDELSIGNIVIKIYKLENADFFYIFLRNKGPIFDISSPSKDFLVKVLSTFRFLE